jgi:hypothetical protein
MNDETFQSILRPLLLHHSSFIIHPFLPVPNVSNLIKTIQDIMRKDAGVDGDGQRLELETELYRRAA